MKLRTILLAAAAAAVLAGCSGGSRSPIGLVDVQRLTSNWPKYINYQNQLVADEQAISSSKASLSQKRLQAMQLEKRYAGIQNELVKEVRDAATQVAHEENMKLVVTREFVGYGGTDITPEVEKILGITEKATPSP